jgi:phage gp29-like protein
MTDGRSVGRSLGRTRNLIVRDRAWDAAQGDDYVRLRCREGQREGEISFSCEISQQRTQAIPL